MSEQRKLVTLMYVDLGAAIAAPGEMASHNPARVKVLVNRIESAVTTHGGTIENGSDNCVLGLFGARQAREDDAARATRAALDLQAEHARSEGGDSPHARALRVGIHTAMLPLAKDSAGAAWAAGNEDVQLARRLHDSAPAGGVLISQDTYRQAYGSFDVQELLPLTIRGRTDPVQTYLVLRARGRSLARTLRGVEGIETEMVGRDWELERLKSILYAVVEKQESRAVTIVGEAGIGKSRLLHEFQKWVEIIPSRVNYFCGRAEAETAALPFSLVRDIFCSRFEIQESDAETVAAEKFLCGFVQMQAYHGLSGADGEKPEVQAHFIGRLLGFDFSTDPAIRRIVNDAQQTRHQLFQSLSRWFVAASKSSLTSPGAEVSAALLVLEDIHWCDDDSLDLIAHLAQSCADSPLMILSLARPALLDRRPAWGQWRSHARLDLEPLSPRASDLLVQSIMRHAPQVQPALRDLILSRTAGNPFYIEETIKMLIEKRVLLPGQGQWRADLTRLTVAVPPTLAGVLQERLDSLAPSERSALQAASVVGHVFWDSALEDMCREQETPAVSRADRVASKGELSSALDSLCNKKLVNRRESSAFANSVEYSFKHELLRDVTYESLLKKSRGSHHAKVADWFIRQSGERIKEYAGLVAIHYEQAGLLNKAAEWYGRAGQQAAAGYAHAAATEYFQKALKLLSSDSVDAAAALAWRLEWSEGLGASLSTQARFAEALRVYGTMQAQAAAFGNPAAEARAWNGLAFLQERQGDNRASVTAAEKAASLAGGLGNEGRGELVKALQLKGWAYYRLSDAPAVLSLAEQTLALCEQAGDRLRMAICFKLFGVAHLQLGHYDEADRHFEKGLALCQEVGDRRNAGAMFSNLGESARLRGDCAAAVGLYEKALAVAKEIGERPSEVIYLSNLAGARLGLGQFKEAETHLRQAISMTGTYRSYPLSETYTFLGEACLAQQKLDEAVEAARKAVSIGQESENLFELAGSWRILGRALAAIKGGDSGAPIPIQDVAPLQDSSECFRESLRLYRSIGAEDEEVRTLLVWAECERRRGNSDESTRIEQEARQLLADQGARTQSGPQHSHRPHSEPARLM